MNVRLAQGAKVHDRFRNSLYARCGLIVGTNPEPTAEPLSCKKCIAAKAKVEQAKEQDRRNRDALYSSLAYDPRD